MEFKGTRKTALILSSYAPLYVILFIVSIFEVISIGKICSALYPIVYPALFPLLLLLSIIIASVKFPEYVIKRSEDDEGRLRNVKNMDDKSDKLVEYLVVYVAFFAVINNVNLQTATTYGFLFLIVIYIQYKTNYIHAHPVFAYLDLNIYRGDVEGKSATLLTRKRLSKEEHERKTTKLSSGVYLDVDNE